MPLPPASLPEADVADRQQIVAGGAVQEVAPAVADQGVVTLGADEDLAGARTDEDVVALVAEAVDRAGEIAAEHDVALTGIASPPRIGAGSPDDQVGEAIAVDVARAAHREARAIVRVDAIEAEAVGAVEGGEVERATEAARVAEHHVALTGIARPRIGAEPRRSGRRSHRR